jgi:hypothetical protein
MIMYCNCHSYHALQACVPSVRSTLPIPKLAVGCIAKLILFRGPEFKFWLRYRLPFQVITAVVTVNDKLTVAQVAKKKSPHFALPEGSLPRSQQPATCISPEPDQFNTLSTFNNSFNIMLPKPCNVTEDRSPASHCGGPGWVTGQSMRNMSWTVAQGHFINTALPSTPWSSKQSSSFTIYNQNHEARLLPPMRATCPAYPILDIWQKM